MWTIDGIVLMAALAEGFGAFLFVRALLRFGGGSTGLRAVWTALIWNIVVWLGFNRRHRVLRGLHLGEPVP